MLRRMARGQAEPSDTPKSPPAQIEKEKKRKKRKNEIIWNIPDDLVAFMLNIPRSIQAKRENALPWLLKRCWKLFDIRTTNDIADNTLGYNFFLISVSFYTLIYVLFFHFLLS